MACGRPYWSGCWICTDNCASSDRDRGLAAIIASILVSLTIAVSAEAPSGSLRCTGRVLDMGTSVVGREQQFSTRVCCCVALAAGQTGGVGGDLGLSQRDPQCQAALGRADGRFQKRRGLALDVATGIRARITEAGRRGR